MAFATTRVGAIWTDGVIPYDIQMSDFDSDQVGVILRAIKHWNDNTIIRLINRVSEADFVLFVLAENRCQSSIGQIPGGQNIGCDVNDGFGVGSIIHEIGHAVGLFHEQTRPGRDIFVTINWRNIRGCPDSALIDTDCGSCAGAPGDCGCTQEQVDNNNCEVFGNFIEQTSGIILTEYDYDSIMHYGRDGFTKNGNDTITPLQDKDIGQRNGLSRADIHGVCALYGAPHFAVVWRDDHDQDNKGEIRFTAYSRWGKSCGPETVVSKDNTVIQADPRIAMDGEGQCVIVWEDGPQNSRNVLVKGLTMDGSEKFPTFVVNDETVGEHMAPDVGKAAQGEFTVVWQERDQGQRILSRGFNESGSPRFGQIVVCSGTNGIPGAPAIAIAPNGSFVVVWGELLDESLSVKARGFMENGTERFSEITVASGLGDQDVWPKVAIRPDGMFVVSWERSVDDVEIRGFNTDGSQRFATIKVNTRPTGRQFHSDIAMQSSGRFIVIWTDDSNENHLGQLRARGFTSDGQEAFKEFTVNLRGGGDQRRPRIMFDSGDNYYVVWEDDEDKNGFYQIHAQALNAINDVFLGPLTINRIWKGQQLLPSVASR